MQTLYIREFTAEIIYRRHKNSSKTSAIRFDGEMTLPATATISECIAAIGVIVGKTTQTYDSIHEVMIAITAPSSTASPATPNTAPPTSI